MTRRAVSMGLLYGGITLIVLAGLMITAPVLWGRPYMERQQTIGIAELGRLADSISRVRDATDVLRRARDAERGYLLTGSEAEHGVYAQLAARARQSIAALRAPGLNADAWSALDAATGQFLAELDRSVALQAAGHPADAIAAGDIDHSRALLADIDAITNQRAGVLRGQYRQLAADTATAGAAASQFEYLMFTIAAAMFAFGCTGLMMYQRRVLADEAAMRASRDAALEASVLKSRFVATASHDLRQPLHAIAMFVGVLRRRVQDAALKSVVDNIAVAVESMQRMFAALLDVARLDANAIKVECRGVALHELFHVLEVEFASSIAARGLVLQIQPCPFAVATDPALLETILRNLLTNAVKFTDHGVVGIATRRHESMVDITVFDTGIGIAPEDHARVFGQFERGPRADKAREGLGLGLAIVQRMADLLGIRVTLESRLGEGSRFTLSLPLAELSQSSESAFDLSAAELHGQRILVVDDHPEARQAIALAIETLGGVPLAAGSPDAARRLLAAMAPERPAAAVVDHDLGGGQTGPGFLDAYTAATGRVLPAVVITGSTEARTLAALTTSGRPWLIKPVDLDVLRVTLAGLIDAAPALAVGQRVPDAAALAG